MGQYFESEEIIRDQLLRKNDSPELVYVVRNPKN